MNVAYYLAVYAYSVVTAAGMQFGPFDGLLACEKAASQIAAVVLEAHPGSRVTTVCLRKKDMAFKYREPK